MEVVREAVGSVFEVRNGVLYGIEVLSLGASWPPLAGSSSTCGLVRTVAKIFLRDNDGRRGYVRRGVRLYGAVGQLGGVYYCIAHASSVQ